VIQFNAQICARDNPPLGYEMLWAVGIDACVVCSLQLAIFIIGFVFSVFDQVPIAKPSDLLYERELANGQIEVDIIEAERRFFCVYDPRFLLFYFLCNIMRMYKWVHGIKFQAICLPNGMIGNLAGRFQTCADGIVTHEQELCWAFGMTRTWPMYHARTMHCT
jgi:hypothetical protein